MIYGIDFDDTLNYSSNDGFSPNLKLVDFLKGQSFYIITARDSHPSNKKYLNDFVNEFSLSPLDILFTSGGLKGPMSKDLGISVFVDDNDEQRRSLEDNNIRAFHPDELFNKSNLENKLFSNFFLSNDIIEGTGNDEEADGVFVNNVPINLITVGKGQAERVLADIRRGELSMTPGPPILYYDTERKQLIIEDGNHRIFQRYLEGGRFVDARIYSSSYHSYLRPVYDGEDVFDWSSLDLVSENDKLAALFRFFVKMGFSKEAERLFL